jgi:two-component system, NtrC family, sensor histidine kinase HydH
MRFVSNKKLYLPALTLIAVVLSLILIIAVSTFRNLSHQRQTALAFLNSQGIAMLQSLEAAISAGAHSPMWTQDSIKVLIEEFGKSKNLAYIYIFGKDGKIIHAAPASLVGTAAEWRPNLEDDQQIITRLHQTAGGRKVYELAKRFLPSPTGMHWESLPGTGGHGMMHNHHIGNTVVLALSMAEFETAHRADLQHAFVMGAILLALGSGALFFIFVIQNYYVVDRALDKSRDYLKLVMASMSNGMLSIDTEGNIITINNTAQELLGIGDKEISRFNLQSIIDFQESGIVRALTDGTPVTDVEIVYEKTSGRVVLSLSVSAIIDADKKSPYTGAVIMLRDLTEIKQLQEKVRRSEKLAAIGELAAGIAHEVRNPLSSIRGFAQFLKRVLKDRPKESQYAELMVKEVDRINNVVTNLLSFARPLQPEPAPTDIRELLRHTIRLVEEDARIRNVDIQLDLSPGQDLHDVDIDASQMTQVMLNLVLNALQAVDAGGRVRVAARVEGGALELSVEDDGPGIPPDRVKRIFDPFFTTKEKGTGLGMAIVQMIVENSGGEIRVSSPVRGKTRGCRISVVVPVAERAEAGG